MAAIFDFHGSVRLGRERNLYQGAVDGQKEGVGWGSEDYASPKSVLFCKTPVGHERSS